MSTFLSIVIPTTAQANPTLNNQPLVKEAFARRGEKLNLKGEMTQSLYPFPFPLYPDFAKKSNSEGDLLSQASKTCPQSALSRLIRHKVVPGETLESIAQQYNLIPANGCQTAPKVVFVPGVNWSPKRPDTSINLTGYPLPSVATVALGYGWQLNPGKGKVAFHSGLDLLAAIGTSVKAVGAGTVAFAGKQGTYGNLVVVNHQGGKQSRYAQLENIKVKVGQKVLPGDLLGTVGTSGTPSSPQPHLHFEMRYASDVGWVAEDPNSYLKQR